MPTLAAYCDEADRLLKSGAPLQAYDIVTEGLREYPGEVRLRQFLALSLARSGASRTSNDLLRALAAEGHSDEETLGLLARTYKDLAFEAVDPAERASFLAQALHHYGDAYARTGGYWSGINAATMALLLDRGADAAALARAVHEQCVGLLAADPERSDRYWVLATLGEAALVGDDVDAACEWYRRALDGGRAHVGDRVSTRRNARLILHHLRRDTARVDAMFDVPRVAVFAGHLVDRPGRASARFPPAIEHAVRDAVAAAVDRLNPGIGFASAACGGDILFLEALVARGAEIHIVLPYSAEQFRADSVDVVPGADWGGRFDRLLGRAASVVVASDARLGDGAVAFEYGFRMLDGLAGLKADELDDDLACVALWDGRPGDGRGGTAASVAHWERAGRAVEIVDIARLRGPVAELEAERPAVARGHAFEPEIVGLLFADVRGFSRLGDDEIPLFVEHFLGTVAAELAQAAEPPLLVNTWGDGLYIVFAGIDAAGCFALALRDAVRRIDWRAKGFHIDLALRIGLHAGPAYACFDPVVGRRNYIGAHVSRAARIEPVTPPGEVYASRAFAALARSDDAPSFRCSYVGQTPLAKGYGTFPTYVVRPDRGTLARA